MAEENQTKRITFDEKDIANATFQPRTTYFETFANLFKANVGTGCFAMASAMRNSGILLGPIATLIIATICVHCFHILVQCSEFIKVTNNLTQLPNYAETVELTFIISKKERFRKASNLIRKICNVFICLTQLGFCSVYFVFVGRSVKLLLDFYGFNLGLKTVVTIIFIPIWISALLRKLKHIAIFSTFANACMILGTFFVCYYAFQDLPPITDRPLINIQSLPLFFGTTLFAFTGIAVIIPLLNVMKKPEKFSTLFGVLNMGMLFTTIMYVMIGFVGYWHYGEETEASITLNLPINQILAQLIILMVAMGVASTVAIQFYVAVQIMLPFVANKSEFSKKWPILTEEIFRSVLIFLTFIVAQVVPNLGLLLSFIGAGCCTALVFVFPVMIELIIKSNRDEGIGKYIWIKNLTILVIAFAGGIMGMGVAVLDLIREF